MHMADALLSPTAGGAMWLASAAALAFSARRVRAGADDRLVPLMGVLGAFVFAAQMVNFAIPGTGSRGHLGGGLLLVVLLGPHAALIVIASVLTVQALFLYRYAFVLGAEAARMATARRLRSYGPLLGQLLLRAFQRPQRIHQAMLARGFDGEMRSLRTLRWQVRDTVFVCGWCAAFAVLRGVDLPQWLGSTLLGCCR